MPGAPSPLALGIAATALAVAFVGLHRRQARTRNATSVDAAWAIAIGLCGAWFALVAEGATAQRTLAAAMAVAWSSRLSIHLLRDRVMRCDAEDGRYAAMRAHWGASANRRFFWFYLAQAGAALVFALPFAWVAATPHAVLASQWCGAALAVAATCAEAAADGQLAAHRADPSQRGRTCRRGLWRWSRHPNYFFEWLTWCGVAVVAHPFAGWWAALHPAVMFVLVRFVSGVPFAERQALKSRGEDYRRYQRETNTFVPWLQRRAVDSVR